jgi:hypothetical protein
LRPEAAMARFRKNATSVNCIVARSVSEGGECKSSVNEASLTLRVTMHFF